MFGGVTGVAVDSVAAATRHPLSSRIQNLLFLYNEGSDSKSCLDPVVRP